MHDILDAEIINETALALSQKAEGNNLTYESAKIFFESIVTQALENYRQSHKLTSANSDYELLDEFLAIKARKSPNTYRAYLLHISKFLEWLAAGLSECTPKKLAEYESYLREHELSDNSVASKLKSIKSYLSYASDTGYLPNNPGSIYGAPAFTAARKERELKRQSEQKKSEIELFFDSIKNPLHKIIFELLAKTGMRASELIGLQWCNELPNNPGTFKILGKGKKERFIYIPQDLYEKIKALKSTSDFIFSNRNGGSYCYSYLYKICKQYVKNSNINPSASLHWFRHWYANQLRLKGVDIFEISSLLGHASITTTQKYFHSNKENNFNDLIII